MAFLSGAGQDIYAQRLKRSASIDRNLKRSRVPSTATSTSSMQPSSSSTHSSSQSSTPARSRLPSAASNLSSSHHPSPGSSVRPAVGGAQASISSSSTTRASTHTGSSGAQPAQRSNHPTPIAATASSSAPTSHDGPRPVHHIASFSDLGGRQRTQTVSTTRLPKQTVFPSSKPSPSTSSSSLGPPRPHTDSQSGSLSDPSSRPRSRLDSSGVRRYGAPMSPQRNGNHSDGGGSSDRSPGPAAHLDVKRLLSKPAGPSRASLYSVTSDSDSPAAELLRAHSPASHSPHALVSSAPWLGFNGRGHLSPSANRASPSRDPSPSRSLSMDKAPRRDQVSPIRSLTPLSPSPSTPKVAIPPLTPTTLTGDKERDRERDRERPRVLRKRSRGKADHRDNGAVGGRASASLHTGGTPARRPVTADGRLNSDTSPLSARLTPAGAIARAYKEQETRHENLAAAARGDLATPTESPKPPRARRSSTDMKGSAQPSYTVFGSSAVFTSVSMERQQDYRASPLPLPSATTSTTTESARRSLVRKVSGRFSRQKSISNFTAGLSELPTIQSVKSRSSSSQQSNRPKTSSEPRKSLQERRSTSLLKDTRRKSLRISLDEQPDGPDELGTQKRSAEIKTADSGQGSESSPNSATATGARLWKLVKRLSSSSLHAKYQGRTSESSTPTSPPPVPAIPKDLLQMPTRFNVAYGDEKNTSPVYNASRPSQSPQRSPATTNEPRSRRPSTSTGVPKPSPVSGRRSTTTRSSSPSSLFRPPSRSSMSSIADDVPPIPSATVRVLSPRAVKPELAPDDAVEPLVPRSPPSPDMVFSTAGTVNNFVGRRPSAKQQRSTGVLDVNGNKSSLVGVAANPNISTPPPRPMRSPNRVPLASQCPPMFSLCSPLSSPASSSSPATPSQPSSSTRGRQPLSAQSPVWSSPGTVTKRVSHDTPRSPVRAETESVSRLSVSTARPRTSSGVESRSPSGVRVKFREMSNGPPPARTAQEKDRMWDDLLERSDLAGGTLHLGGGALMSDTLRFSTISSASSMST